MSTKPAVPAPSKPTTINPKNANQLDFEGSSNMKRATFDPTTSTIEVEFVNGGVYRYGNFTPQKLGEWLVAPSAGKWFAANMKGTTEKPSAFPLLSSEAVGAAASGANPSEPTSVESPPPAVPVPSPPAGERGVQGAVVSTPTITLRTDYDKVQDNVRAEARKAYEAYAENSNNLTFDGRQMPKWADLNHPVKSHWCAAVTEVSNPLRAELDRVEDDHKIVTAKLSLQDSELQGAKAHLARHPDKMRAEQLEKEIAEMKAHPSIARVAMLEGEIDLVRAQLAKTEADLRAAIARIPTEP